MSVIINPITQQANITLNASNIGTGSLPGNVSESLIEVKYSYTAFNQDNMSIFTSGDVVVFEDNPSASNAYGATLLKANTGVASHASKMLMIFVSYSGSTLILMHKGYIDFDAVSTTESPNALGSWTNGRTLYISGEQIAITPPAVAGNWVKSIGFCMPNLNNKKRIWFESDSTYLTLQ